MRIPLSNQVRQYCLEHHLKFGSVLKLCWAIVLNLYYDTPTFVTRELVDEGREDAAQSALVHYVQDFAKKSSVVETIRSLELIHQFEDQALFQRGIEKGASQLPKIWSQILFVRSRSGSQDLERCFIDGRRVRSYYLAAM